MTYCGSGLATSVNNNSLEEFTGKISRWNSISPAGCMTLCKVTFYAFFSHGTIFLFQLLEVTGAILAAVSYDRL